MEPIFCCTSVEPYRPQVLNHEHKFTKFRTWAEALPAVLHANEVTITSSNIFADKTTFVIQVVRQVNFGPLESKRYFAKSTEGFQEVTEKDLIDANYQKLNSYKNFKCTSHNKFFELNVYEKDPINMHHWRVNLARPASEIDLPAKTQGLSMSTGPSHKSAMIPDKHSNPEVKVEDKPIASASKDSESALVTSLESNGHITFKPDAVDESETESEDLDWGRQVSYDGIGDGRESPKDFTACSASDCGYCGHCDY